MLNLAEYRQRPALLADWLPWAALVAPGVAVFLPLPPAAVALWLPRCASFS